MRGAEILVLDEPTAVLTPAEADQLFEMLRVLKGENKTIIFITHKLREIMSLTDRVSVMRRGEMVATFDTAKTSPPELADAMVGRKVILKIDKGPAHPGKDRARGAQPRCARRSRRRARPRRLLRPEGRRDPRASPASRAMVSRSCSRRSPACRPLSGGEILVDGEPLPRPQAQSAPRAPHRHRPRAGGSPSRRARHAVRGVRERHARLPSRAGLRQGRPL